MAAILSRPQWVNNLSQNYGHWQSRKKFHDNIPVGWTMLFLFEHTWLGNDQWHETLGGILAGKFWTHPLGKRAYQATDQQAWNTNNFSGDSRHVNMIKSYFPYLCLCKVLASEKICKTSHKIVFCCLLAEMPEKLDFRIKFIFSAVSVHSQLLVLTLVQPNTF